MQQGLKLLLDRRSIPAERTTAIVWYSALQPNQFPAPARFCYWRCRELSNTRVSTRPSVTCECTQSRLPTSNTSRMGASPLGVHDSDNATRELFPELDKKITAFAEDPNISPIASRSAALAVAQNNAFRLRFGAHASANAAPARDERFARLSGENHVEVSRRDGGRDRAR